MSRTANREGMSKCSRAVSMPPALPRAGWSSNTCAPAARAISAVASLQPSATTWMLDTGTRRIAEAIAAAMTGASLWAGISTATSAGVSSPAGGADELRVREPGGEAPDAEISCAEVPCADAARANALRPGGCAGGSRAGGRRSLTNRRPPIKVQRMTLIPRTNGSSASSIVADLALRFGLTRNDRNQTPAAFEDLPGLAPTGEQHVDRRQVRHEVGVTHLVVLGMLERLRAQPDAGRLEHR